MIDEKIAFDIKLAKKYMAVLQSATSRGKEFALSMKELSKLIKTKKCFFTNKPLNDIPNDKYQLTLDRVDNDKGYIDGNVVACSKEFNSLKGELTINEIKLLFNGLKKKNLI